jgi:hypothetical protein
VGAYIVSVDDGGLGHETRCPDIVLIRPIRRKHPLQRRRSTSRNRNHSTKHSPTSNPHFVASTEEVDGGPLLYPLRDALFFARLAPCVRFRACETTKLQSWQFQPLRRPRGPPALSPAPPLTLNQGYQQMAARSLNKVGSIWFVINSYLHCPGGRGSRRSWKSGFW